MKKKRIKAEKQLLLRNYTKLFQLKLKAEAQIQQILGVKLDLQFRNA